MDEVEPSLLLPYDKQSQEQEAVLRMLVSHLKEGKLGERKKKILDFCKSNAVGEKEIRDLLLHSSSISLSYFPDQAR